MKYHPLFDTFGKRFFTRNQQWILWLLNTLVVRWWFRWAMRIPSCDCPRSILIHQIMPNAFSYNRKPVLEKGEWRLQQTTQFMGYPKYSKRIYHSLFILWWVLHLWDLMVADSFWPELSFGFSTLTVNPHSGSGGANVTCDGYAYYNASSGTSWATLIAEANATTINTSNNSLYLTEIASYTSTNNWYYLYRSFLSFDTSSLGAGVSVSAAVLSAYVLTVTDALGCSPNADVYTWTPASNANTIVNADFSACGSVSQTGSPLAYSSITTGAYNAFNFNTFANINQTGVSCFSMRNANYDTAATAPTWSANKSSYIQTYSADWGSNEPKLVITYSASTPLTSIGSTTGTPAVGDTLTAGSVAPGGATVSYQWQNCSTSGGTYSNISGATSSTYVCQASDEGMYIEVVATGTGSYTGSETSVYVGPITLGGSVSAGLPIPSTSIAGLINTPASGELGPPIPSTSITGQIDTTASGELGLPIPSIEMSGLLHAPPSISLETPLPVLVLSTTNTTLSSTSLETPLPSAEISGSLHMPSSSNLGLPLPSVEMSGLLSETTSTSLETPLPSIEMSGSLSEIISGVTGDISVSTPLPSLSISKNASAVALSELPLPLLYTNTGARNAYFPFDIGLSLLKITGHITEPPVEYEYEIPLPALKMTGIVGIVGSLELEVPIPVMSSGAPDVHGSMNLTFPFPCYKNTIKPLRDIAYNPRFTICQDIYGDMNLGFPLPGLGQ